MASKTLNENINQAISDFKGIKQALIDKGVEIPQGTPTSEYGAKIEEIQSGGDTTDLIRVIDRSVYSITLPEGLTKIGSYAFQRCENLSYVEFPSSLYEIDQRAFNFCISLKSVTFPQRLGVVWNNAFANCTALTTVRFLGTPTGISDEAFSGCTNLKTIRVPWASGKVANAPWGAPSTVNIVYNYKG